MIRVFIRFYSLVSRINDTYLEYFFIEPDYIGKGYGKLLWDFLLIDCKRLGINEFNIVTSLQANEFYVKMGAIPTNDNGFGIFRTFLYYKLREQGKQLVIIDKWYPSSKTCHVCGKINNQLTLADRVWTCSCGAVLNRDVNAAINIRNEDCHMLGIA